MPTATRRPSYLTDTQIGRLKYHEERSKHWFCADIRMAIRETTDLTDEQKKTALGEIVASLKGERPIAVWDMVQEDPAAELFHAVICGNLVDWRGVSGRDQVEILEGILEVMP